MADWYCSSVAYTAVAQWAASHTYAVGNIVRQLATPSVGNERCFRVSAITTGVSSGSEPAWVLTKGATTTDSGVTWIECTGNSAQQQNGGVTNTWTAPHARLANACSGSWASIGDRVFISSDSAETQSTGITISVPGYLTVVSVNRTTGNIPPLPADITYGATVASTAAGNPAMTLNFTGWVQGIIFQVGTSGVSSGINTGTSDIPTYQNCAFQLLGTTGGSISAANNGAVVTWDNVTVQFANTASNITTGQTSSFLWRNTALAVTGATFPAGALLGVGTGGRLRLDGVDLSALSNNIIFTGNMNGLEIATNCKVGANCFGNQITAPISLGSARVELYNCDSANTNWKMEIWDAFGGIMADATTYRSGGATDGVTPISHCYRSNLTSSSNRTFISGPLVGEPIFIYNSLTGSSHTATVCIASGSALNNNDVWLELEYPGTSSYPLGNFVNNFSATVLTTPAAQTTDASSTWTFASSWNAADFSNTNTSYPWLLATKTVTTAGGIRANIGSSSGKIYVEFTVGTLAAGLRVGFANPAMSFALVLGSSTNGVGYNPNTGAVQITGSTLSTIQTATTGDVIGMALDLGNNKIWIRTNAGNWNNAVIGSQNPATNTGGISTSTLAGSSTYFASFFDGSSISAVTANFGPSFTNAAPSGFGPPSLFLQQLQVTFTAQQAGLLCGRVKLAKSSTVVYVDPLITIT